LPLEQEFTLTPKIVSQLQFFEVDPDDSSAPLLVNGERVSKEIEVVQQQKVLRFDETGVFQDEQVEQRLRQLASESDLFARDIDLFIDFNNGVGGAFTGETASVGARMIISTDGGATFAELNNGDIIAQSVPALGQNQVIPLTLDEDTVLGYRLFVGSGSIEVEEDFIIEFDETDSVYVETIDTVTSPISETPFLDDLTTLNLVYDDDQTFVDVVNKAVPIVTNRTGLEFDLSLLLSGLAAAAHFEAGVDVGPLTLSAGLGFEIGPLFEEEFELLNVEIVDLFNDSFSLSQAQTTASFVLGDAPTAIDFGDAIVGTSGDDTALNGTAGDDVIIGLAGNDTINAGAGDDLIQPGEGYAAVHGGDGYDTLSFEDLEGVLLEGVLLGSGQKRGAEYGIVKNSDFNAEIAASSTGYDLTVPDMAIEHVRMSEHNDTVPELIETLGGNDRIQLGYGQGLVGLGKAITVDAGDGDDRFEFAYDVSETPWPAGWTFEGGAGRDKLEAIGFDVDLTAGVTSNGITLSGIEDVTLTGDGTLRGDEKNNVLTANGASTLLGEGGNDTLRGGGFEDNLLIGGAGADDLNGASGSFAFDTASYATADTSVFIDLDIDGTRFGRGYRGDAQGDTLTEIEQVIGSDYEDILIAGTPDYTLDGGDGDDRLLALGGNDILRGGDGDDLLAQGAVADEFGGTFNTTYDGGEGFDIVGVDVSDKFLETGTHTGKALYTFTTGYFGANTSTKTRDVTIYHKYDRSAHVELALDEAGDGTISYVEDDATARVIATWMTGTASYSSYNPFGPYAERTVSFSDNISDQLLPHLLSDSVDYSYGSVGSGANGSGRITSVGSVGAAAGIGTYGTETVIGIEGLIGSKGDDLIVGNSSDNAFFGDGGADLLAGGGGNDRFGFGEAQSITDNFTFPGSGPTGGSAPVTSESDLVTRLKFLNPDAAIAELGSNSSSGSFVTGGDNARAPVGKINVSFTNAPEFVDIGSFLWGGAGIDTLDMRHDRGLSFFPDTSDNYARVKLEVALSGTVPINNFTNETVFYGWAEWFNGAGARQSFATTYGIENVIGSENDDEISGDRRANVIEGLGGSDTLDGGDAYDLPGTTIIDTLSYALADESIVLNLRGDGTDGWIVDNARADKTGAGDANGDYATGFEAFIGSDHDDTAIFEGIAASDGAGGYDPTNAEYAASIDLGQGNDHLEIEGLGAVTAELGDGDDIAEIRNVGHSINGGAGVDVITVLDGQELSLEGLSAAQRTTTIDGGDDVDTVVFTGRTSHRTARSRPA